MSGLPKIALARLKANSDAAKAAVDPVGTAGFQGAEHPDANLLAAFAEKTLTEQERTQVLNHLSQCADCRAVAAFVLPDEAAAAAPARVAAPRSWNPWRALRWGATAAVLGMLTVVVSLHPGLWNRPQEISQKTPPPAVPSGGVTSDRQSAPPESPVAAPSATPHDKSQMEALKPAREMAAAKEAAPDRKDLAMNQSAARAKAQQRVAAMRPTQPPATLRAEGLPGVTVQREESKAADKLTAAAPPLPLPQAAPAPVIIARSEDAAKGRSEERAGPTTEHGVTQSVEVTSGSGGGIGGGIAGGAIAAKAAPRARTEATVGVTAQAPMVAMQASRQALAMTARSPAVLWSVSADGKVQRSTDGGKTYGSIHVARGVKFRAIAAIGNNVWAGGTGGYLFHSADGGLTWTQVSIPIEGSTVTEAIVGIQFPDAQHLTITTSSGSPWVSADGGQHWQKP